jgi:hypothetical protein
VAVVHRFDCTLFPRQGISNAVTWIYHHAEKLLIIKNRELIISADHHTVLKNRELIISADHNTVLKNRELIISADHNTVLGKLPVSRELSFVGLSRVLLGGLELPIPIAHRRAVRSQALNVPDQ